MRKNTDHPETAREAFVQASQALADAGYNPEDARREANKLLSFCLGEDGLRLLLDFDRILCPEEEKQYWDAVRRFANKEPMAYLTGEQDFGNVTIQLEPGVLIPRQDTLVLVEAAIEKLAEDRETHVLELGSGSGAVIVAIAIARPLMQGLAVDVDPLAVEWTRRNLNRFGLDRRIQVRLGSWFEKINTDQRFSMIVANPPYISTEEMKELDDAVKYEPVTALWGGADGMDAYREIVPAAYGALDEGGWCLVEIGWKQGPAVKNMFEAAGFQDVAVYLDEGGRDRVVAGKRAQAHDV